MVPGLVLVWCVAGLAGLHLSGVGAARGPAAWADNLFAAVLGPFSFLIAMLASEMAPEEVLEEEQDASAATGHVPDQRAGKLAR